MMATAIGLMTTGCATIRTIKTRVAMTNIVGTTIDEVVATR
jgi:hypothetical protein